MKHRYLVTTFIVSFAAASGAGFFAGANYTRFKLTKATKSETVAPSEKAKNPTAEQDTASSEAVESSEVSDESSNTHIVQKGDTLYSIGLKYNINWPALAKANGLEESSVLKEGQVIKIPSESEAKTIQAREYVVPANDEEKQNLVQAQTYADAGTGQLAYRLVPTQVVQRSPLLSRFSFNDNDLFIEKSKDTEKGEATVEVTHAGDLHTVYLSAYEKGKGDKTVWTPVKVTY